MAALADVDPDLVRFLSAERQSGARRELAVRVVTLPRGHWPIDDATADPTHLGSMLALT